MKSSAQKSAVSQSLEISFESRYAPIPPAMKKKRMTIYITVKISLVKTEKNRDV